MASRASAPRASVDLSALLSSGEGNSCDVGGAAASPAALRAYVAARARAAASSAAADAAAQAARAAELDAWSSRLVVSGGTLATLLREASEAQAASPLAASRPRDQAALADARAEARRLLAAAHDEAEAKAEALPLPLPLMASVQRRSLSPHRAAPLPALRSLPPARPPWERWTSPARPRRAGSEPPTWRSSDAALSLASVTPLRLDYCADEAGRPSRYGRRSTAHAIQVGATSAERAEAVMSVRRATRAAAARARADTYAHLRDVLQ